MASVRRAWPVLVFLLIGLVPVFSALSSGRSIGPFDQIAQMAPWNRPAPDQPWDVLQADGVLQFYGWRDLVLSGWNSGEIPFWNPHQLAGTPLLANSQSGALYPPHIVLGILGVPAGLALVLLAWFHLAWAGLGAYALVRALGGPRSGGLLAGVAFAWSPFLLGWLALASVPSTVAWIPWLLAGIVWALARPDRPKGAPPWSFGVAVAAASTGMMLLAGHLQFSAYGLMAAATLAVGLLIARPAESQTTPGRPLRAAAVLGGLALGALVAAPQFLSSLDYSQFSHRRNTPTAEGYQAYVGSALTPSDLLARLTVSTSQGDPTQRLAPEVPLSTFWPALSKPGANFAESAVTLGPVVFVFLLLLVLAKPDLRRVLPVAAIALLALLLLLGTPLNALLYNYFPGWSSTGSPARVAILFVLASCVLAGLAVRPLESESEAKKAVLIASLGALGAFALAFVLGGSGEKPASVAPELWSALTGSATTGMLVPGLVGAVLAIAAVAALSAKRPEAKAAPALAATLVALVGGSLGLVRAGDPSFLRPETAADPNVRIAAVNEPWGLTQAAPAILPPNTATPLRRFDLGGYDSLLHRETVSLLREINGQDPAPPANGNMMFVKPTADPSKLAEAGVGEVWTRRPLEGFPPPAETRDGYAVIRLDTPGRASTGSGPARIAEQSLNRVVVEAQGPATLTLRDRNLPGWTAVTEQGQILPIREGTWLVVEVPDGQQRITFRYAPPGFPLRALLGSSALALTLVALLVTGRKRTVGNTILETGNVVE